MSPILKLGIALLAVAAVGMADTPSKTPATASKAKKRKYRSSSGKPSATAPKTSRPKRVVKTVAHAPLAGARAVKHAVIPRGPKVSASTRAEAHEGVFMKIANGADLPVENAAALVPFFELLYRHQKGEMPGPVRILHYGDSHTAADEGHRSEEHTSELQSL